jgi:hypothetical protein
MDEYAVMYDEQGLLNFRVLTTYPDAGVKVLFKVKSRR